MNLKSHLGAKILKGRIYFITSAALSRTSHAHPLFLELMKVQKRMRGVRLESGLITVTTDPRLDTPELLQKAARNYQANPFYWNFLTGPKTQVDLFNNFLKQKMVENKILQESSTFNHLLDAKQITLVDRVGQIRGFYSFDQHSINKLMIDVGLLINKSELNRRD